ncbi:MAG: branched-chain amino acid ABC transporter permease [Aquihabitans sp.]
MGLFFDQFVNGIGRGVIYASIALALVLIFRTTGLLNFAQGEMALFSTFITYRLQSEYGLPIVLAIVVSMLISMVAGAVIERTLIRPVSSSQKPLNVVIVTLGMFLAINALAQLIFIKPGEESLKMPSPFPSGNISSSVGVASSTVWFAAILVVECVLLWVLFQKTKVGLSLRAVASNPESSKLVGINTGAMLMLGWALAAGLGAVAGSLVAGSQTGFDVSLMQITLIYALAGAALGGFDSPMGAVVGGLTVGVVESLTVQYGHYLGLGGIELLMPFALILVVLLVKPNGLFGRTIVERV